MTLLEVNSNIVQILHVIGLDRVRNIILQGQRKSLVVKISENIEPGLLMYLSDVLPILVYLVYINVLTRIVVLTRQVQGSAPPTRR